MTDTENIKWEEVESAAPKMFSVWVDGTELEWAKEAWSHLTAAGLVGATTILDITTANLRLVTLALIYQEFCGFAWDENPETPVDYLAEDLEIDPVALGVLAAKADPNGFEEFTDDYELREADVDPSISRGKRAGGTPPGGADGLTSGIATPRLWKHRRT